MKFVCERCQTKYSIADEKVRGKVLKVRCKSCSNVITVREPVGGLGKGEAKPPEPSPHDSGRTAITSPAELQRRHAEATRAMEGARSQTAPARSKSGPVAPIPPEALSAPGTPKAPPPASRPPAPPSEEPIWYLAVDGKQTGPFTAPQLADKVLAQPKTADVHVWNPGLGDWRPPAAVPEVHALVEKRRRPAPPPPPATAAKASKPEKKAPPAPVAPPAPSTSSSAATPVVSGPLPLAAASAPTDRGASAGRSSHGLPAGRPSLQRVEAPRFEPPLPSPTELDELLKDRPARRTGHHPAQNGLHHAEPAAAAAPSAADVPPAPLSTSAPLSSLSGGESDALAALTLAPAVATAPAPAAAATEVPQEMAAASEAPAASTATDFGRGTASEAFFAKSGGVEVPRTTGESELIAVGARRHRNVKLVFGLAAVVVVVCSVFAISTMQKPTASKGPEQPKTPKHTYQEMAEMIAREQSQERQQTSGATEAPRPTSSETSKITVEGHRDPRRIVRGSSARGILPATPTAPPPLSDMSPDQKAQMKRLGLPDDRGERSVPQAASSGPKNTPSQGDISRVITNNKSGIQTCYQRALLRDPSLKHGKLNVQLSIGISGKVKKVSLDAPVAFRALEPCIRDVVTRWPFPPSSEEYVTEFPFVLQGAE